MDVPSAPLTVLTAPAGEARVAGRRCFVTVLFSDVSDSSRHAEELEAEDYAALLERFRAIAREVIPRHGGSIARMQGDGVLALFGHLEPREDDGLRAAEAALDLHARVARLRAGRDAAATQLKMHSGIHAGLLLLIDGDIERGRFDVVGEVPNTAARLCSMARGGELLVSAETLGPHANFFVVASRRRSAVRGRSKPLVVVRVTGRALVERRIDAAAQRGRVPFVGRDGELNTLLAAAGATPDGSPSVLQVSGEPGVGKTRLLDEFQARLDRGSHCVMHGYCEDYLGAEPMQPFMQILRRELSQRIDRSTEANAAELRRSLSARGFDLDAEALAAASALLGLAATPALSPQARRDVAVNLLALLARGRTAVLVLDDWQWADDASREVLQAALRGLSPLVVLLAERTGSHDDDPVRARATLIPLGPLDATASQRAIAAWLPEADAFLVQDIYRHSGGSPLFIEELCHEAAAGGDVTTAPAARGTAWVGALVASRLARVPAAHARTLQLAAVVGMTVPAALLEGLNALDPSGPASGAAALQDFLLPAGADGVLRFRHILAREAIYATVESNERQALHLRVAQWLEARASDLEGLEPLEALAYHYHAAGRSEQAARFAESAGDKALVAMALDRARAHYLTALRSLDALPMLSRAMRVRWCEIAQKLGQTCVFDPLDVAYGFTMFERAVRLAQEVGDLNVLARAEYWVAYVNYGRGRPRQAVKYSEAALDHATRSGDQRLVAQVQATLGQSLASAGRYDRALPLLREAVEHKRQHSRAGSGTAIGSAYSLGRMAYTLGDLGRFDDAAECFEQSFRMLGDVVHSVAASVRELVCAVHLWQGRWHEAREAGMAGAELALRCRSRYLTAMGRALGSCAAWAIDGDEQALRTLRDATHWIEVRGGAVSTSLNHGWLVEVTASLGLQREMRGHAARLLLRARAQDTHGLAVGARALAQFECAAGRIERARHYLALADRAAQWRNSPRERAVNTLAHARLALHVEERGRALDLLDAAARDFEAMNMHWHLARARELAA
jgi:class 3 adenylate cyclase/tetratricopeptide (TPR) repeat protein